MTADGSPAVDATTWAERIDLGCAAMAEWRMLPTEPLLDRVFKAAGFRDLVAERDALREELDDYKHQFVASDQLRDERDSARRERGQAVGALRQIAAHPHGGILVNIANRALVELGESKP